MVQLLLNKGYTLSSPVLILLHELSYIAIKHPF